jgi:DNA-binding transcriptional LysR family regulator
MAMDLRQLTYFAAIVDLGSLSAAARTLHISQPSLTVVLHNLEREFGAQLLVRTAKGVQPTEAGNYLREVSRRILMDVENAGVHLRSLAEGHAGRVSLAITPTYSWAYLSDVLGRLGRQAPGIQIVLRDPPPLGIIEDLTVGAADIGVVATYDVTLLKARYGVDFHARTLCELPIVAVLPAGLAGPEPTISLNDLRDHPWVVPTSSHSFPGMAALTEKLWLQQGWTPRIVREVSTSQTGLPIIAGGLGVALMPDTVSRLTDLAVTVRQVREVVPPLAAVLMWQRDRPVSPAARLFMDTVTHLHRAV